MDKRIEEIRALIGNSVGASCTFKIGPFYETNKEALDDFKYLLKAYDDKVQRIKELEGRLEDIKHELEDEPFFPDMFNKIGAICVRALSNKGK